MGLNRYLIGFFMITVLRFNWLGFGSLESCAWVVDSLDGPGELTRPESGGSGGLGEGPPLSVLRGRH